MEKKSKVCRKVQSWIILNKGERLPLWVKKHIESCTICEEFEREELLLIDFANIQKREVVHPSLELDLRVKRAIFEVSSKLSKKGKSIVKLRLSPKAYALIASFLLIFSFFYLPLFNGENYFAFKFNRTFNELLSKESPVYSPLKELTLSREAYDISGLKFMNAFFDNEPYKSFYYAYRDLPEKELLAIRFFSDASNKNPEIVYKAIKEGNFAKTSHILGLSYKDTLSKLKDFLNKSSYSNENIITVDGLITSIDYIGGRIYIDSIYEPIYLDFNALNTVYIGKYVSVKIERRENLFFAHSISESELQTTILKGNIKEIKDNCISLSNMVKSIYTTGGTIVKDGEERVDLNTLLKKDVLIRAVLKGGDFHAISIYALHKGEERIIIGEVSKIYGFGFTLRNMNLNFYWIPESKFFSEKTSPLRVGDIVTIKGIDYRDKFSVKEIMPLYLAKDVPAIKNLYRSRATISESEFITSIDYILSIGKNGEFILKSGRVIKLDFPTNIPLGAKVKIVLSRKDNAIKSLNLLDYGKIKKINSDFLSAKKVSNNILILRLKQKPLFLYSDNIEIPSSPCIIQAKYIDYGDFGIVEKMRIFSNDKVVDIRGSITNIIEDGTSYLLDNGYILSIDDLSHISGGSLSVGKTVDIRGVLVNGVVTGYIVKVSEDYGFISGTITEINFSLNYVKLDSGIVIKLDPETIYAISGHSLEIGDQILCKVSLINGEYLAKEISLIKENRERIG